MTETHRMRLWAEWVASSVLGIKEDLRKETRKLGDMLITRMK